MSLSARSRTGVAVMVWGLTLLVIAFPTMPSRPRGLVQAMVILALVAPLGFNPALQRLARRAPRSLSLPLFALLSVWGFAQFSGASDSYFPMARWTMYGTRFTDPEVSGYLLEGTPCSGQPRRWDLAAALGRHDRVYYRVRHLADNASRGPEDRRAGSQVSLAGLLRGIARAYERRSGEQLCRLTLLRAAVALEKTRDRPLPPPTPVFHVDIR